MEGSFPEATRLISEALSGPRGVTELTTHSGRPVRVERDPERGIQLRLTLSGTDAETADWLVVLAEAADERPDSYPATVPFVRGVETIVAVFGETVTVTWQPAGGAVCPMPEQEPDEELTEVLKQLKSLREKLQAHAPESRTEAGYGVKAFIDSLDLDSRGKLEELWHGLRPDAEVAGRLEQIFNNVYEASIRDGWRLVEKKADEGPVRSLKAQFERGTDSRSVLMMALSRSVFMIQGPRKSDAAA